MVKKIADNYENFNAVVMVCMKTEVRLGGKSVKVLASELDALLIDLKNGYDWNVPEERMRAVCEQHEFWEKLSWIAKSYSELFDKDAWSPIVFRAFSTGNLPYPLVYLKVFDIHPGDAAPYISSYLSYDSCQWIVDNWEDCELFRDEISAAMKKSGLYHANLMKKCRRLFGVKVFAILFLFAVVFSLVYVGGTGVFLSAPIFLILFLWLFSCVAERSNRKHKIRRKLSIPNI